MAFPSTLPEAAVPFALRMFLALLTISSVPSVDAAPKEKVGALSNRSAVSVAKSSPLDTTAVRRHYLNGDFDPAIDLLETGLLYKTGFTHEDSVFIFKHLGVMYAAKYETREKGKQNMLRLLEVEPTARIMDMYASDMIYMIFKNIQDEFDASRRRLAKADTTLGGGHGAEGKGGAHIANSNPSKKGSSAAVWLGAGTAVAAAAGVATWYYFSDKPKTTVRNHELD